MMSAKKLKHQCRMTGASPDGGFSESIGGNIEKVKKFRAEKRALIDQLKGMNERLRILDA